MQFGICGGPDVARAAGECGYDFAEWYVGGLLKPREPEEAFLDGLEEIRRAGIPYPVVNCFIPGDLKITGPNVDQEALREHVTTVFRRCEMAGMEIMVFGSGGARRIPEGFDRGKAWAQLVAFCSMAAPIAAEHGVTIVVEPLHPGDCNVLTTVSECAELVREIDRSTVRLLVDAYHHGKAEDSFDAIIENADLLSHVHIATVPNRLPPGAEPWDFGPFFAALKKGGYDGRISIEGDLRDFETSLPKALSRMRDLAESKD